MWLKKSEFCKKYNINCKEFTDILLSMGLLERVLISTSMPGSYISKGRNSKGEKIRLALTMLAYNKDIIRKYKGSNQQGQYKYKEEYFKKVLENKRDDRMKYFAITYDDIRFNEVTYYIEAKSEFNACQEFFKSGYSKYHKIEEISKEEYENLKEVVEASEKDVELIEEQEFNG